MLQRLGFVELEPSILHGPRADKICAKAQNTCGTDFIALPLLAVSSRRDPLGFMGFKGELKPAQLTVSLPAVTHKETVSPNRGDPRR